MAAVTVLSWNIKDLNEEQINDPNFISMVVKVIQREKANLVSILETKSDKGRDLKDKLKGKLGGKWDGHPSPKSAPCSNKPENYVYLWDGKVVTNGAGFHFPAQAGLGFPNQHNNIAKKKPSRFPYVGSFQAGTTTFYCVAFHTTFASVDIAEANQNLAKITEVSTPANDVIVMGDFNDDPANSRTYQGVPGFAPLIAAGCTVHISVPTSLCQAFLNTWNVPLDCRANVYDNFFVRGANLAVASAEVVDLVAALQNPLYLGGIGRELFNSWATRQNKTKAKKSGWTPIKLFGPGEKIANLEDAHEVHWVAISDHLPIRMVLNVT